MVHATEEQREHLRTTRLAEIKQQVADWTGEYGQWFWLSFCDPERPKGHQFLGCAIPRAPSPMAAPYVAHLLGVNPGGEVALLELPDKIAPKLHPKWTGRLLTKDDVCALDRDMGGPACASNLRSP